VPRLNNPDSILTRGVVIRLARVPLGSAVSKGFLPALVVLVGPHPAIYLNSSSVLSVAEAERLVSLKMCEAKTWRPLSE
jgi:hypothetical protein